MPEVMGETEDARHVATAHFSGGLADFAIECLYFFHNENARGRTAALDHERGGRAGEGAADDDDVVVHRGNTMPALAAKGNPAAVSSVIPSEAEGSRGGTLMVTSRDPSTSLGMTEWFSNDLH